MAIQKAFTKVSQDPAGPGSISQEYPSAYHRIRAPLPNKNAGPFPRLAGAPQREIDIVIDVFADADAASEPAPIAVFPVDENGYVDYQQAPTEYVERATKEDPLHTYVLKVTGSAAESLLYLGEPIPAPEGTDPATLYRWDAQAYRYLMSLPEFEGAESV